jgi:pantetheine-phosphate adenylyltransferase
VVKAVLIAIYPGSFDPITFGHLDIIMRGSRLFDRVIVVVSSNPNKTPLFSTEKRIDQIQLSVRHLPNIEVDSYDGLSVTYARLRQAQVLLRGLRVLSDFEKELQMAHTNKTLAGDIETLFLSTSTEYGFLSSSLVKEIAQFGGPVDHLVPHHVARDICQCYAPTRSAATDPMALATPLAVPLDRLTSKQPQDSAMEVASQEMPRQQGYPPQG